MKDENGIFLPENKGKWILVHLNDQSDVMAFMNLEFRGLLIVEEEEEEEALIEEALRQNFPIVWIRDVDEIYGERKSR